MTAVAKPLHEPAENEFLQLDPPPAPPAPEAARGEYIGLVRGLLDQIVENVGHVVDAGLEAELRARLAAVLPAKTGEAQPEAKPRGGLGAKELNVLIGLLNAVTVLDEHARRARADGPTRKRDAACRDFLRLLSERVKSGDVAINQWEET